jgi:hypothetical protein
MGVLAVTWARWDGPSVEKALVGAAMQGLIEAGEGIVGRDAVKAAPVGVDGGALRGSLRVAHDESSVYVGMGSGPSAAYAIVQHEDMGFAHPRGGGPKFLERALFSNTAAIVRHVDKSVREGGGHIHVAR